MLISLIRPYFRDKVMTKEVKIPRRYLIILISLIQSYFRDKGMTKDDNLPSKDS